MTILAPPAPPPQRHLDAASDVAVDFLPREPAPEPRAPSLRIVHLGKYFHPAHGGIERTVRTLAHAQARIGCSVRVICMDHERGRATHVEQDGPVEVVRLRRAASFCKIDHCPDLPKALRDSEADLLHLHTPNPSMILGLMLSGDRRPLVVSHHSDILKQRLRHLLFGPFERACYDRARLVLAMSPPYVAGSALLRRYPDRVAVLPIGLELAPFLAPAPEVRAHRDRLRRYLSRPALVFLRPARVLQRTRNRAPGPAVRPRHLADRRRWAGACAAGTTSRHGLISKDRARFLGDVPRDEDLAAYYLAADAFWFPSNARSEAYGLVQVEAMASGCPVINTAIPHSGVPWVSRHEETGLTVPVDDPAAFAAAALRLLEEPGLRDRLAAGARARAIAEFQCEAMGRRSLALYSTTLAAARRGLGHGPPSST